MSNIGGTHWRTLQPQGGDFGSAFTPLPQQPRRQITKNPQNMFSNYPLSPNGGTGPSLGGFSNNSVNGGFNSGPMSPTLTSSQSAGRLNHGRLLSPQGSNGMGGNIMGGNGIGGNGSSGFDFGMGESQQPSRLSPSFGGLRLSRNSGFQDTVGGGRSVMSNGFGLDRSMSNMDHGALPFDQPQFANKLSVNSGGNSFNRQSSVPSSMDSMSNGFGRSNSGIGSMMLGRDNSPPLGGSMGYAGGKSQFNDMQIGTWDSGNSSGSGNGMNRSGGANQSSYFEIGTFSVPTSENGYGSNNQGDSDRPSRGIYHNPNHTAATSGGGPGIRGTGIIEKLLHSYGFIQCCDRQARLFFHFSQFDGTIEHLKIGDPVEFEMTYDRRTGKPIASLVSKIAPEVVMSGERVIGTVTTEAKVDAETGQESGGRISYENRGECFFLPFSLSDVEGNVTIHSGDKCSFQMATMARSGTLVARTIRLENPVAPVKYQGVINSVKDKKSCGFIERSDVVREIFFHFNDVADGQDVDLGDDVEFTIETRNGKEVACNITALPQGTVVFEDVGIDIFTGQVLKPLDRHLKQSQVNTGESEALNGRIKYRGQDRSEIEVLFGEKDQVGDFTLRHGDWVKFVIAIDRRDKLKRATKIELVDESFNVSDERREQGTVQSIKEDSGYIRCADRNARLFFYFSECLDVKRPIEIGDECEFTVEPDDLQLSRMVATRIKHLERGTVEFDVVVHRDVTGRVVSEPQPPPRRTYESMDSDGEDSNSAKECAGKVVYELNGLSLEIPLYFADCENLRDCPRKEDIIKFDINQSKATKETNAVNIRIIGSPHAQREAKRGPQTHQGYIAALKDGFGFVETLSHEKEIFFHFGNVEGKPEKLEVGMEVEYTIFNREKGGKVSAEGVKVLNRGSIPPLKGKEEVLNGKVVRPIRSVNPDQDDYCGLIQVKNEEGTVIAEYEFGIASLFNKKELLQVGDPVQFQVHLSDDFAVNIQATREKLRANVEAMKGQFGFLSYEVDEGKKLFFHTSEVEGGELLQQGDEVEFVVVTNKRTGKHSACCVRKLSSSKRPERLISKLKTMNLEDAARGGKKIVVVRQPKGPDGGSGFKTSRNV